MNNYQLLSALNEDKLRRDPESKENYLEIYVRERKMKNSLYFIFAIVVITSKVMPQIASDKACYC